MSRPSIRRAFAGLALAALLATAAPARATSLRLAGWLPPQDLWSRAWSWLTNLWTDGGPAEDAAVPETREKDLPALPPPSSPHTGTSIPTGDVAGGLDPDG